MSRKFLTPIDMTNLEILNLRLQQTQPAGTVVGLTYYDATTTNRPQVYSGAAWNTVPFVGAGTPGNITPGTLQSAAAGVSNNAARLDHTHGSPGPAAGPATNGFMLGTDKAKLDASVSIATPSTLVIRDVAGRFQAVSPSVDADVAIKSYVDNVAAGMSWKPAVKRATIAVIDLTGGSRVIGPPYVLTTAAAQLSVDGANVANTDRILVKNGTTGVAGAGAADNGIYVVSGVGTAVVLTRASDMDTWPEAPAAAVFVEIGGTLADTAWVCTADAGGTLGTTAITFVQFAGAATYTASGGITLTGNNFALTTGVVTPGTYTKVTVDTTGRVTAGAEIVAATGFVVNTAAATYTNRSIAGTASRVAVTNGSGVAGNPTIDIDAAYVGQTSITTLGTITTGTWTGTAIAATRGGTGLTAYVVGDLLQANTTTTLATLAAVAVGNVLLSGGIGVISSWGKVALTTHVSGTLPIANGGTNSATALTASAIMVSNGTAIIQGAQGTTTTVLHGNAAGVPTYSAVSLTADITGTLGAANGGTGNATYAIGDLLQASAATTLSRLAAVAVGNVLLSGGVATISSWGKVGLTTHVSGTLPIANGGTNSSAALTASAIMVSNGTAIIQGAQGTTTTVLHGNAAGVPTYGAVSLTADVSGILPQANGGTGFSTYTTGDILYASATDTLSKLPVGTAGQVLKIAGGVPTWATDSATPAGATTEVQFNSSGVFGASPNFAWVSNVLNLGSAAGAIGALKLNGSTSGSATIKVAAVAGAPADLTLPTTSGTSGYVLTTDGAGLLSWAAAGASVLRASANVGAVTGGTPVVITTGVTSTTPIVQVYEVATQALVECDIVITSSTQISLTFAANAVSGTYRWVLLA